MSMRIRARHIAAMLVSALVLMTPGVARSAPWDGPGTLELTITTPVEGAALVEVARVDAEAPVRAVVHDSEAGPTEEVELAQGTYRITPRAIEVDGQRYVARSDPYQVRVKAGRVSESSIEYAWSKGAQNLRATEVTETSISLDWDAERGQGTSVWRVEGDDPATGPGQGTKVSTDGSALTDSGLAPGTTYSYSIFARPGDGAFGRTDVEPVTIIVGTVPEEDAAGEPTYALNPRTVILSSADFASAAPTGDRLRVDLEPDVPIPTPGTILSVPVTDTVEGGYLGEVVDVSDDGRSVWLIPAAMAEAFDLFHVEMPDVAALEEPQLQALSPSLERPDEEARARASRSGGGDAAAQSQQVGTTSSHLTECSASGSIEVTPSVGISHAGHADVTIDKYEALFIDVPTGVSFDVGYSATLQGALDIEATNTVSCGLALPNFYRQITLYPVPLALDVRPEVGINMSSAGAVSDLGFTATAGFEAEGYLGFEGDNSLDGGVINDSSPTQPTGTGTFGIGLQVGGSVSFGPGVGTSSAGVLVGIGGQLLIVDASIDLVEVDDGDEVSTCIELSAATTMGISATLRAWLPGYSFEETLAIEPLQGSFDWGGSPWHWPEDCTESDSPTDDVVGDGVTAIADDVTGSSDQWGNVEGLVPGESTWVLSTGRIQEAVGEPAFFASTDLDGPGDAELSALSGFTTHDAAAYTVTVVPNGQTLSVRYAFASEEYPEYVGSDYNDVMAVFVDGVNCALVPGTQTPVSVNTVNADSHAQYFVDNESGAAGYGTSMDGLTTPLTCSVPVTPGEPVTIRIAVADASDGIFDSAVALLDDGIWSE